MNDNGEDCPRCTEGNIREVTFTYVIDNAKATVTIWYCPECLYIADSMIDIQPLDK